MQLDLSDRQRTAVATAVTIIASAIIICAVGAVAWLLTTFVRAFSSVFLSLAVAGVAAMVFHPYYEWLEVRKVPKVIALGIVFVSILIPFVAFGWFFGAKLVGELGGLVEQAPALWNKISAAAEERWPSVRDFLETHPVGQRLRQAVEGAGDQLDVAIALVGKGFWSAGKGLARGIGALLSWAVLPVYFAYFLAANPRQAIPRIDNVLPFLKEGTRADVVYLVREFVDVLVAFFRGQIIIAFMQGILFALGFSLVRLEYGLVLGLALGFLNVIPYLGSIVGLSAALPLAMFQDGGGIYKVVWVLVVFTVVQLIEGYVLTPKIMGDRTGLHPLAIIVSIFFWGVALDGIMGMILAIPLTAFLVVFWRLVRDKYIGELL